MGIHRGSEMVNNLGTVTPFERRAGYRFPVSLELSYREVKSKQNLTGRGKTINISSSGILFAAEHPLVVDANVELTLLWPVLLNDEVPLLLKVNGRVLRTEGSRMAIEILQYEFRISGRGMKANGVSKQGNKIA